MPVSKICCACGGSFDRPLGLSEAQWQGRRFCSKRCAGKRRPETDAEILALYESGLSSTEIAERVGVSSTQVSRIVRRWGEIRSASERQKLSHSREGVKQKMARINVGRPCPESVKDTLRARVGPKNHNWRGGITASGPGYLQYTASPANQNNAGRYLHVVVAENKEGRRLGPKEVVHHKDHNKMNNDPSNLEVMSHSEHARLHALKTGLGRGKKWQVP